jgi:gamma-glutamyl-gamma-aminobutyrate hydrolase PuuD
MSNSLKLKQFFVALVLVASSWSSAFAQEVEGLQVWKPANSEIKFLIPKIKNFSAKALTEKLQERIHVSLVYSKMENAQKVILKEGFVSDVPPSTADHPNVAVVLNRPNQMVPDSPYLPRVIKSFEAEGPRLYAIPVGMEEVLSPEQMREYRAKLNSFDGQLGVGGDDLHPTVFGQLDLGQTSGDISVERDRAQMAYMEEYMEHGKGRVFYVCGSMQRAAVIKGHAFHCDISHITKEPHKGTNAPKMMEIVAEPGSELATAAGSTRFETSNYHHQGVDLKGAKYVEDARITAFNIENGGRGEVVKAIEFKGNAGFATQFHPEFRGSPAEANIMKYVSTGWKMRGRYAPADVVKCMDRTLTNMLKELGPGTAP